MFKSLISHKITILLALFLLLQLPLSSVLSLNQERQAYRAEAIAQITTSSSGPQRLTGPVLVIPYIETSREYVADEKIYKEYKTRHQLLLLPEALAIDGNLQVEPRKLGIYQSQLFHAQLALKGRFVLTELETLNKENIQLEQPYLAVAIKLDRLIVVFG